MQNSSVEVAIQDGCLFRQRGVLRPFGLHDVIFQQDSGCRSLYRVKDGLLALRRYHRDGGRTVVRVVRPGETVGWADAFISGVHRWEGWALSSGSLWCLPAADWISGHSDGALSSTLALAFAETKQLENAVLRLSYLTAEQRLLAFLLSLADRPDQYPVMVRSPVRRADLAEVIAIRPESYSRAMSRLQDRGLVKWTAPDTILIEQRAVAMVAEVIDLF